MNGLLKDVDTSGKIRALMAIHKITQDDLALLLDCSEQTIRNRFIANRWDVKALQKMAEAYKVDVRDLI